MEEIQSNWDHYGMIAQEDRGLETILEHFHYNRVILK